MLIIVLKLIYKTTKNHKKRKKITKNSKIHTKQRDKNIIKNFSPKNKQYVEYVENK